jgi:hypothetical protein
MEGERWIVEECTEGKCTCTDAWLAISCTWEKGRFNDTQRFSVQAATPTHDATYYARAVREMADWLRANHYRQLF